MKLGLEIAIPIAVLVVSAVFLGVYNVQNDFSINPFKDKNLLEKGLTMPTIWLYYDNSDVNARFWSDFGARSGRVVNIPFLNLCYERIVELNKAHYKVEVISGLTDLAVRLGGWEEMPKGLQNPLASVGPAELNWIRAEVLAKFGGLWVHPASICLKPFPLIPNGQVVFYGTDADETYKGTSMPSMYVMGAGNAKNPVFERWAQAAFERLDAQGGGTQIRNDAKWDFKNFASTAVVHADAELSRKPNGKRIQVEDLLAAGQEGNLKFKISSENLYVPVPWPELQERRQFGWFLRMSEEQILNSDLAISDLLRG